MKAISAVIATIMLLMITVSLISVFYVFSSTLTAQTTSSGGEQVSQLTKQLTSCMQIDNIYGNQVTLRNCGKGVIENSSLTVTMDDIKLGASALTINEADRGTVNVTGLWQISPGAHSLKISNGATTAQALVDVQPNKDGLVGGWNFDEGQGSAAYDGSGNGNAGTLANMNTTGNATSGWTAGKYGSGLQFDGWNDYVRVQNSASLNPSEITMTAWVKRFRLGAYHVIVRKGFQYFRIESNNRLMTRLNFTDGTWTGDQESDNARILDNDWHLVQTSFKSSDGTIKHYIDGVEKAIFSNPAWAGKILYTSASVLDIGSSNSFNGTIDEVRIWNKTLAPDETVGMKQII